MVGDALQVAGIALLKSEAFQTRSGSPPVSCVDEIPGNVDSNDFRSQLSERNRRRAIAATQVQDADGRFYSERLNNCLARLTHQSGNLGEVAFFPQCFVWIWIHDRSFFFAKKL